MAERVKLTGAQWTHVMRALSPWVAGFSTLMLLTGVIHPLIGALLVIAGGAFFALALAICREDSRRQALKDKTNED